MEPSKLPNDMQLYWQILLKNFIPRFLTILSSKLETMIVLFIGKCSTLDSAETSYQNRTVSLKELYTLLLQKNFNFKNIF